MCWHRIINRGDVHRIKIFDSSHASTGSSYSSPSADLTQHPASMAPRPTDPNNLIRSGLIWPLYAVTLPPLKQQYYSDRGRPPGILQPFPNIAALTEYNDSSPDNLSLGSRLRHWRSSGSSWTRYIRSLFRALHHWYQTIPLASTITTFTPALSQRPTPKPPYTFPEPHRPTTTAPL
jgi:hypothetical protein